MDTKDKIIKWFLTGKTGNSSKAIVAQMMRHGTDRRYPDYPLDGGDFGRCHGLLEMVPEFKPRMQEMADRSPQWAALVEHWDELTEIYCLGVNSASNLHDRMKLILSSVPDRNRFDFGNGMSMFIPDNDK